MDTTTMYVQHKYSILSRAFALALVVVWTVLLPVKTIAQAIPDSRGTEFVLAFSPNFHLNNSNGAFDSLYIVISAATPTNGAIEARNASGTTTTLPFATTAPAQTLTLSFPWRDYELRGYNREGVLDFWTDANQNGKAAPQSFRVRADNEIAVYALSQAVKTSDAAMLLPTDVLGTDYYIMSYYTDGRTQVNQFGSTVLERNTTPSQLTVVAAEDGTVITITPSVPVLNGRRTPITAVLQRGDAYLLQADVNTLSLHADLTGTRVTSTKPIAVFAGHQRALLPVSSTNLSSRDHLFEQMPPVPTWGKQYILAPFPSPTNITPGADDMYRVVAAYDNTDVRVGGALVARLKAGQWYEAPMTAAAMLTATHDVLVAQYKRSAQTTETAKLSDPFMAIIPPRKQFLRSYVCSNAQAWEEDSVYHQQYISVICPTAFIHTVRVDGNPVAESAFRSVPASCYSYAWIPTTSGTHGIEAATECGVYVYGYGFANSYGYVGGMAMRSTPDTIPTAWGDTTMCIGGTAQLVASGGVSYAWSGSNLSCTDCPTPTATPSASSLYTVTITDSIGCAYTHSVSVRINQLPVPIVSRDTTLCPGDTTTLVATGGTSFAWSPSEGLSCTDCPTPRVAPTTTTTYTVVVGNMFGCTATSSIRVAIAPMPTITLTPDTTMCPGQSLQLQASGGVRYQWSPSEGLSCTDCPNPIATPAQPTTYYATVFNSNNCSLVDSVRIELQPCTLRAAISALDPFATLLLCDSAEQYCTVRNTGDLPVTVQSWDVQGTQAASFSITPVLATNATFPIELAPNDSLQWRVLFQPAANGVHTAQLRIHTTAAPEPLVVVCTGYGKREELRYQLGPAQRATPGDTVVLHLSVEGNNWHALDIHSFRASINHHTAWMKSTGVAVRGTALDPTWQLTTSEHLDKGSGMSTTLVEASGTTPLLANGTIATLHMVLFTDTTLTFTPELHVFHNDKEQCVQELSAAAPINITSCVAPLRAVRFFGEDYFFQVVGGTVVDKSNVPLHYGIGLAAPTHIEVYNHLGTLVHTINSNLQQPGKYEYTAHLPHLATGVYVLRFTSGPFTATASVILQ